MIETALNHFSQQRLDKIVISQVADFELLNQKKATDLAMTLSVQNPFAYSFVVPVDQGRYLFGASPELLLAKENLNVRSNPLAGSRPRSEDKEVNECLEEELRNSDKDLYEHKIVVDSILKI